MVAFMWWYGSGVQTCKGSFTITVEGGSEGLIVRVKGPGTSSDWRAGDRMLQEEGMLTVLLKKFPPQCWL